MAGPSARGCRQRGRCDQRHRDLYALPLRRPVLDGLYTAVLAASGLLVALLGCSVDLSENLSEGETLYPLIRTQILEQALAL